MTDIALRVEGLSKRYRIGKSRGLFERFNVSTFQRSNVPTFQRLNVPISLPHHRTRQRPG